ncbi:MAG: 30S ribosomal protein THX [Arenimonas sp.]
MGKGDRKTAKGKRNISSYGKSRPNTTVKPATKFVVAKSSTGAAKAVVAKKAPAKKAVAK